MALAGELPGALHSAPGQAVWRIAAISGLNKKAYILRPSWCLEDGLQLGELGQYLGRYGGPRNRD